jgi:deoxyribodipyrimidine photo-lyase
VSSSKLTINILWFKRDLRLNDHQPLAQAAASGLPLLMIYFFEPSVLAYPDADSRHWRFVQQSLQDLNRKLAGINFIYSIHDEVIPSLQRLLTHFHINTIYSHEETGTGVTFKRDQSVAEFCKLQKINWQESPTNGIVRRLYTRKTFTKRWLNTMSAPMFTADINKCARIWLPKELVPLYEAEHEEDNNFQPGGIVAAEKYLQSFLFDRKTNYARHISKPELSRKSCSRLSPYLAWGNLSMKQVYQATLQAISKTGDTRNLNFFIARLHWHCHFIQKFETECRMEFENLNSGFDLLRTEVNPEFVKAWESGTTGYPLVDACMRCVKQTGYLNFRMRSMVVSFFTHHLWQPWQAGAHFLARQFLDYEPGIHYPQFQMQAGTMGVNTIRIYNPIKQSQEHDTEGTFIKKWVPELCALPTSYIHTPWLMSGLEQQLYKVRIGLDYPPPIVDITQTAAYARVHLWQTKKSGLVKTENARILRVHTKRKTEQ